MLASSSTMSTRFVTIRPPRALRPGLRAPERPHPQQRPREVLLNQRQLHVPARLPGGRPTLRRAEFPRSPFRRKFGVTVGAMHRRAIPSVSTHCRPQNGPVGYVPRSVRAPIRPCHRRRPVSPDTTTGAGSEVASRRSIAARRRHHFPRRTPAVNSAAVRSRVAPFIGTGIRPGGGSVGVFMSAAEARTILAVRAPMRVIKRKIIVRFAYDWKPCSQPRGEFSLGIAQY